MLVRGSFFVVAAVIQVTTTIVMVLIRIMRIVVVILIMRFQVTGNLNPKMKIEALTRNPTPQAPKPSTVNPKPKT